MTCTTPSSVQSPASLHTYFSLFSLFKDSEIEILEDLQAKIMQHDEVMKNACDICAELDVLLSFAEASRAYDYRRPLVVDDSVIDIVGGRCVGF